MRNDRAERRKKKMAERAAAERRKEAAARSQVYPEFALDDWQGTPEFVELVTDAIAKVRFDDFPKHERETYKLIRSHGAAFARRVLAGAMAEKMKEGGETAASARIADVAFAVRLGEMVFANIPRDKLLEHIPHNDVQFTPHGRQVVCIFSSLLREPGPGGTVWYSRRRPTLEIDGNKFVVAFSRHAIERTCERLKHDWTTYAALGDVFAYFDRCVYFERADLYPNALGFTFWDMCGGEKFVQNYYVLDVLGEENLDRRLGDPYYRVGYCPAVIEGGFVKAKTLLFPGYSSTPEYGAVLRSGLTRAEKDALLAKAAGQDAMTLYDGQDFSAVKWWHDNGVPQVMQTKRAVFAPHVTSLPKVMRRIVVG